MGFRIFGKKPVQIFTPLMLFGAFVLLLFVSLSLPIIKGVYILNIKANLPPDTPPSSIATEVRFGLWGYCASGYDFSGPDPVFKRDYLCSHPKLGYTIDPVIIRLLNNNQIANIILKSVTYVLIVHPVACGLTLFTVIPTLVRIWVPTLPGFVQICTLLIAIVPAIVTTIVFVVDIVLVVVARSRIEDATNGSLTVTWGTGVWMTCGAMTGLWLGIIGLSAYACGCCGLSDQRIELKLIKKQMRMREKEKSEFDDNSA